MKLNNYAENVGKRSIITFVLIDLKKRDQGRYCICNESKNNYLECIPETEAF